MKKVVWLMSAIGLSVGAAQAQSGSISISSATNSVNVVIPNQTQTVSDDELNREIDDLMSSSNSVRVNHTFGVSSNNSFATPKNTMNTNASKRLDRNAAPSIAARVASGAARGKSVGLCATYVRKALQSAGYQFTPQASAYQYANGTLASAGFTKLSNHNYAPQVGDVAVFNRTAKNPHGHIQIYDGTQWVSDFRQPKFSPYSQHNGYTVWRDSRYLDASSNGGVYLAMNDE